MSSTASRLETGEIAAVSKGALWTGRVLSAAPVLLMGFSAVMKLVRHPSVIEGMAKFGFPDKLIVPIGVLEISCALLYVIPRTSVLGAVLVAAYLGGATVTLVRVGDPTWLLPVIAGIFAWLGLWLREPRLHALTPLRK
jgi:DoxX-like family